MSYITLDQAKKHLNIESGFTDDNIYIESLISVAELAVSEYCNSGLSGYTGSTEMPVTVYQATLLLIAHYYVNREIIRFGNISAEIPYAFKFLLDFYRDRTIV